MMQPRGSGVQKAPFVYLQGGVDRVDVESKKRQGSSMGHRKRGFPPPGQGAGAPVELRAEAEAAVAEEAQRQDGPLEAGGIVKVALQGQMMYTVCL